MQTNARTETGLKTPSNELHKFQESLLVQLRRLQPQPHHHHPPLVLVPCSNYRCKLHGDELAGGFALGHSAPEEGSRREMRQREKRVVVVVVVGGRSFVEKAVGRVEGDVELAACSAEGRGGVGRPTHPLRQTPRLRDGDEQLVGEAHDHDVSGDILDRRGGTPCGGGVGGGNGGGHCGRRRRAIVGRREASSRRGQRGGSSAGSRR